MKKKKLKQKWKARPNRVFLDAKGKYYIKINGVRKYIKVAHPDAKLKNKNINKLEQRQLVKVIVNQPSDYRKIKQRRKKRKEGVDRLHTNGVIFGRNILNKGNMTALPVGFNFDQAGIQNLSNKISGFETSLELFKKNVRMPDVLEREKKPKINPEPKLLIDQLKKPLLIEYAKQFNIPYTTRTTAPELKALLKKEYEKNPKSFQSFTRNEPKITIEEPQSPEKLFKANENVSTSDQIYTTPIKPFSAKDLQDRSKNLKSAPVFDSPITTKSTLQDQILDSKGKLKPTTRNPPADRRVPPINPQNLTEGKKRLSPTPARVPADTTPLRINPQNLTEGKRSLSPPKNYESMTMKNLYEIAQSKEIPGRSSYKKKEFKTQLINLIKQHDAKKNIQPTNLNKKFDKEDIELANKEIIDTNQAIANSFNPPVDTNTEDVLNEGEDETEDGEVRQDGNGYGENEGLYNDELAKILKDKTKKFVPVISADEIPSLIKYIKRPKGRYCFISNTSKSTEEGRHWVAVCIDFDNAEIDYYDSFADLPNKTFLRDLHELIGEFEPEVYFKLKTNKVADQSKRSKNCGWFASWFVIQMLKGSSFAKASGFKNNITKSEAQMNSFRKSYI